MARAIKQTDTEKVTSFINALDPVTAGIAEAVRQVILSSSPAISEHIKWNNPAFYYTGHMEPFNAKEYKSDIAVFNFMKGRIMLVLPHGAGLQDPGALLQGSYKDGRRLLYFTNLEGVAANKEALTALIQDWVKRAVAENKQQQ